MRRARPGAARVALCTTQAVGLDTQGRIVSGRLECQSPRAAESAMHGQTHRVAVTFPFLAQTFNNVLHMYGVHTSKESVVPSELLAATGAGPELQRMHAFLQHSVSLGDGFACNDITGDSRAVVLGMSDGSLHIYSWAAQARRRGLRVMWLEITCRATVGDRVSRCCCWVTISGAISAPDSHRCTVEPRHVKCNPGAADEGQRGSGAANSRVIAHSAAAAAGVRPEESLRCGVRQHCVVALRAIRSVSKRPTAQVWANP